jgi:hypothetical protein
MELEIKTMILLGIMEVSDIMIIVVQIILLDIIIMELVVQMMLEVLGIIITIEIMTMIHIYSKNFIFRNRFIFLL